MLKRFGPIIYVTIACLLVGGVLLFDYLFKTRLAEQKEPQTQGVPQQPPAPQTPAPGNITLPSPPINLTGNFNGQTVQNELSWSVPSDGNPVAGYKIYRDQALITTLTATTTTYADANIQAGVTYIYQVSTHDAAGNESAYSAQVSVTTDHKEITDEGPKLPTKEFSSKDTLPPSIPGKPTIKPIPQKMQMALSWPASTDNVGVAGYHVYLNSAKIATVTSANYTYSNVKLGSTYIFTVNAYDAAGNESPQSVNSKATPTRAGK